MLRVVVVLLSAVIVSPVIAAGNPESDAAALRAAIRLLKRDGHPQEAARLEALLRRTPGQRVGTKVPELGSLVRDAEAATEADHKRRVESLFDFVLQRGDGQRADLADARRQLRNQEQELARQRQSALQALQAGEFDRAADHSREAAATQRLMEANRKLVERIQKQPAPGTDAGLSARLERIEQRLERIETLLRRQRRQR